MCRYLNVQDLDQTCLQVIKCSICNMTCVGLVCPQSRKAKGGECLDRCLDGCWWGWDTKDRDLNAAVLEGDIRPGDEASRGVWPDVAHVRG